MRLSIRHTGSNLTTFLLSATEGMTPIEQAEFPKRCLRGIFRSNSVDGEPT